MDPEVTRIAEHEVRRACRDLGMNEEHARRLVRVEMSTNTMSELYEWARPYLGFVDHRAPGPLKVRGVSFYHVPSLDVPWRVIGLGITSHNRIEPTITEPRDDATVEDFATNRRAPPLRGRGTSAGR